MKYHLVCSFKWGTNEKDDFLIFVLKGTSNIGKSCKKCGFIKPLDGNKNM